MPPPAPSKVQAVLDGTGVVGGGAYPPYTGSFYQPWAGQPYGHANGEFVAELRPGFIPGLTIAADVGVGPNYVVTQPVGWQHGYPVDLVQAYVEYCRGLFCIDAGRRVETFGVETIRPDQRDFTLVSPNFSISPFTRTGASVGIVSDEATWKIGASPGPDRFWNGDNNGFPWFFNFFSLTGKKASFFTNLQMGPDQDANTTRWRINADAGLTLNPNDVLQLGLYGLFMTEQVPTGEWQHAGGGNFYARVRAPDGPIGAVLRLGYTHDDGARTGAVTDLLQFSGGLNVYPTPWLQFRLQGDILASVNGRNSPFGDQPFAMRGTLQMIVNPALEL